MQIYTFGCNDEGALGRDTSEEGSEMVPGKVELTEKVVQVSAGDSHTAALTEDGAVFVWGSFRVSQLLRFFLWSKHENYAPLKLPLIVLASLQGLAVVRAGSSKF